MDAVNMHASGKPAEAIVNCTGLFSAKLGGVMDEAMYPIRGHVALVRNETLNRVVFISGTDDAGNETTYIMKRAVGKCHPKDHFEAKTLTHFHGRQ